MRVACRRQGQPRLVFEEGGLLLYSAVSNQADREPCSPTGSGVHRLSHLKSGFGLSTRRLVPSGLKVQTTIRRLVRASEKMHVVLFCVRESWLLV